MEEMFKFRLCKIDPATASKAEIKAEINRLTHIMSDNKNMEQGLKIFLNSIYGAIGNQYFICYNTDMAEAVTLQGQHLIKYTAGIIDKYFMEDWINDTELHEKMGIIVNDNNISKSLVRYIDTDSVDKSSMINCKGNIKLNIEEMFKEYGKLNGISVDCRNNEIVENNTDNMIELLNYNGKDIYTSKIKKIIRHKVKKEKWRIVSNSGKELFLTNDHSIIVFRDGKKMKVRPGEILPMDKIMIIS